jgi:N4-gp56 family major capsid protein
MQMTGDGIQGDGTLEGNEEALVTYSDNLLINQLRHATRSAGKMSEQRVPFSVREEGMAGLRDWLADRYDASFFNQVCGFTTQGDTRYTGNNAAIAPDTAHLIVAGGVASTETSLSATTAAYFSLTDIDRAVTIAKSFGRYGDYTTSVPMRPVMVGGEQKYVLFLHPYQTRLLRTNTSTGQWLDIQKAAMSGGDVDSNPIFSGALGVYNGVILRKADDVTQGVNGATGAAITTVRRAVLLGAQSAGVAFGQNNGPTSYRWNEELFDHKRRLEVSAGTIFGMKKTRYNSVDFGTVVVSTYAAAHT